MARATIPRDLERRRSSHWCLRHMRRYPLRLGYWQRPWKPSRELPPLRLHRALHLPDLHRLPALPPGGADSLARPGW